MMHEKDLRGDHRTQNGFTFSTGPDQKEVPRKCLHMARMELMMGEGKGAPLTWEQEG